MNCKVCESECQTVRAMTEKRGRTKSVWSCGFCGYATVTADDKQQDARRAQDRANANRRARHQAYTDCGMVRVRGAQGGTYYE